MLSDVASNFIEEEGVSRGVLHFDAILGMSQMLLPRSHFKLCYAWFSESLLNVKHLTDRRAELGANCSSVEHVGPLMSGSNY